MYIYIYLHIFIHLFISSGVFVVELIYNFIGRITHFEKNLFDPKD